MAFLNVKEVNSLLWKDSNLISHDNGFSRYNRINVLKNYENFDGMLEIIIDVGNGQINTESETNIGITNSFITAVECLGASLYSPSVLFASITVECIINHDEKLEQFRKQQEREWFDLTPKNLKLALDNGLPADLLLEKGEQLPNMIKFILRRNKIAHGDTEGYRQIGVPREDLVRGIEYTNFWQATKEDALDQIKKARNFVEAWGKTNPKLRLH